MENLYPGQRWGWNGNNQQAITTLTCPNSDFLKFNLIATNCIKIFLKLFPITQLFDVCMANTLATIQEVGGEKLTKGELLKTMACGILRPHAWGGNIQFFGISVPLMNGLTPAITTLLCI